MKKTLFFLLLSTAVFSACNNIDEKKLERLIKEQVLVKTNKNASQVVLQKEESDQYLAKINLENGQTMELIFKGSLEKYEITETLNSETMRQIVQILGVKCTDLVLKAKDSTLYEGKATLETGETMNVSVEPRKGWFPADEQTLKTVVKYQLSQYAASPCKEIAFQKQESGEFAGTASFENGKSVKVVADFQKGWYIANDLPSLINAVGFEVLAQKQTFDTIFAQPAKDGVYEGEIVANGGKQRYRLVIGHNGRGFEWKVTDIK